MPTMVMNTGGRAAMVKKLINTETTLNKLKPGQHGEVFAVKGEGAVRRRLFDMGVTPGARILVRKVAPLGDPIQISLRGYELTLRKVEAEAVVMRQDAGGNK